MNLTEQEKKEKDYFIDVIVFVKYSIVFFSKQYTKIFWSGIKKELFYTKNIYCFFIHKNRIHSLLTLQLLWMHKNTFSMEWINLENQNK